MQDAGPGRDNLTNTMEYDAAGQLAKTTAPDGRVSEYGYDANGDRVSESVTAGGVTLTTRTVYDAMRRVVRVTGPDGLVTAYEHDALGRVVRTVADAEGEKIAALNAFDAAGRLAKTVGDAGGANESATSYAHDANGNLIEQTDATGRKVKFGYDALNRRVSVTDALGNTARAEYDANGRQTSATDANGRAKTTAYDLAGRPTEQANEMGQKTRYGFDRLGNRLTLTDANGNVTRWTFDAFGRETSMTFPNGDKEVYEYDRLGRMTAKTKPDGTKIRYEYDRLGRLVKIVTPDGAITYEYDAWGRVAKEVSPTRTLTCEYDRLGRLIAVNDSYTGKTVRYAYNRLGAREKLTLDGIDVTYKYDRLLRLSEVQKTGEAAPAQYEHDAAGRRVALKLPNGVKTTYAHDAAGRLTKVESKNAAGGVISAFGYALDATGNRTAMDVTLNGVHNRIEYAFDDAYRLTRETRKDAAGQTLYDEGLTYDPVGNRLTRNRTQIAAVNGAPQSVTENTVYAYNNANQLLTETTNGVTTAYGYDKNGNNTTISTPAANGNPAKNIAMTYDWLNRQTRWSDGTRTESTVFAGADWKRASTTVTMGANGAAAAPSIVKYLYDGDNVLADYDANNALTAFYVTPGLDQNLSITDASGTTSYYTQDGLGSVRLLTSANGAILNRYDYTAFGEAFAPNTATTVSNRYGYTAREQSPLAAHGAPMYYRWRNYAPSVGRFMWRDPIGYDDGENVYEYVQNRVQIYDDAYGLWMGFEHKALTRNGYEDSRFQDPLAPLYLQTAIEANVATDGVGMEAFFGNIVFAVYGFGDIEAAKHYMLGEDSVNVHRKWYHFHMQTGRLHQAVYSARVRAKNAAEERIKKYMKMAEDTWRLALDAAVDIDHRIAICRVGWEYFGTALHTRQDQYSHTRSDWLPMTSWEHGNLTSLFYDISSRGRKVYGYGWNLDRNHKALEKTTDIFRDIKKIADPYNDKCRNCWDIRW